MGFADNQDLWPGDYAVSRMEKEIDGGTSGAEKEKYFKSKSRKRKRRRGKMCNLPGKRAVDGIVREGGVRNSLPALVAKQDEQCWQDADVSGSQLADNLAIQVVFSVKIMSCLLHLYKTL